MVSFYLPLTTTAASKVKPRYYIIRQIVAETLHKNHWHCVNMNQTWQEWSLDGPHSHFYLIDPNSIQDGHDY